MWAGQGILTIIDVGFDYYMVKLSNHEDYNFILIEGPRVISAHYLTTKLWTPNSDPSRASIEAVAIWIRIQNLPIEYFDDSFLKLGNIMGKTLRNDVTTS